MKQRWEPARVKRVDKRYQEYKGGKCTFKIQPFLPFSLFDQYNHQRVEEVAPVEVRIRAPPIRHTAEPFPACAPRGCDKPPLVFLHFNDTALANSIISRQRRSRLRWVLWQLVLHNVPQEPLEGRASSSARHADLFQTDVEMLPILQL
jgi:hypothetical protein